MCHFAVRCLLAGILGICCAAGANARDQSSFSAVDMRSGLSLDQLVRQLATKRVVFIGEIHDRYDHHLNQLEIIKRLHTLHPEMALGVEFFQQPYQSHVDDYIAGRVSEHEFLRTTEYYSHHGFDYRLYAPIFRYARSQRITVRALNIPSALVSAVFNVGIRGLSARQRAYLPKTIEPAGEAYRRRLYQAFQEHPGLEPNAFEHFVQAQLVWDEGMAKSAAAYLKANRGRHMVILAGAGHLEFGAGIPARLERRTHVSYAIVLNSGVAVEPDIADYLLLSKRKELPPAGVLNVHLEEKNGQCLVSSLDAGGAAEKAGLRKRDVLVTIGGEVIKTIADVKLALWDKKPGDVVRIGMLRRRFLRKASPLDLVVKLAPPQSQLPGSAGPSLPNK